MGSFIVPQRGQGGKKNDTPPETNFQIGRLHPGNQSGDKPFEVTNFTQN